VTRVAATRLAMVALLLLVGLLLWWARVATIGEEQAGTIADALFRTYVAETGEVPVHFSGPQVVAFDDGWEYRWIYEPCRDVGELRIFVTTGGGAKFGTTPNCQPVRGFAVPPQKV
jgi:hypothetical protein